MNTFRVKVSNIISEGKLYIVEFAFGTHSLAMVGLDLAELIHEGSEVIVGVKPFHVALAKDIHGALSYTNQIPATITALEKGRVLCSLYLEVNDTVVQSFITRRSSDAMDLHVGERVTMLMKASELFIVEVCDA